MKKSRSIQLSLGWLLTWGTLCLFAKLFTSSEFHLPHALLPPELQLESWSGYDAFGRAVIYSVLRGAFISLAFAMGSIAIALFSSTLFGISTVFSPSWIQKGTQAFLEFLLGIPGLIVALSIAAINGPGWTTLLLALTLGIFPSLARLVQTRTRELLLEGYTQAAMALGASRIDIIRRHLLRGLTTVVSAKLPQLFAHCLLAEATLTFLGVGAPLGNETWGALLAQGRDYLLEAPQIAFFSGLPLVFTLFAIQTLGDSLIQKENNSFRG